MKRLLYLLLLFFVAFQANAQENVFILVDVSKSVKQNELLNAKQLVKDILTGNPINSSVFITDGNVQPTLLRAGSKIMIMPLGERTTVMNYIPNIVDVNNQAEIISFIEQNFPITPRDNWTYISLAKARMAEIAKKKNINNYKLIFVSDNISDDFGGRPNYSAYEQQLVDGYNTQSNPVREEPGIRIKLISNNAFSVFIQKIDVSGYTPPNIGGSQSIDSISAPLKIELTTFKGGTSSKPIVHKENKITIGWFCKNAPKNAQYKIRVIPIGISGEKTQTFTATGNSYNVSNLSNGKWKITVSLDSTNFNASSATTTIVINSGGSYWFLWLLLIAALGGGGYWYWKKTQDDKIKKLNSMSNNDSFSSGSTLNTNSDNSGYF